MTMLSMAQLSARRRHVRFNASEILEIAEQIKCNASRFYSEAVELFADPDIRNTLLELFDWETKYEDIFRDMRKRLSEQGREIRPSEFEYDTLPHVRAMAGLTVFAVKPYPLRRLTGRESKQEILKRTIKNELDIVVFFRGLKNFARDRAARDQIDDVIEEEMRLIDIVKQLRQAALVGKPSAPIPVGSARF
jgi:rubrerythrin